VGKQQIEDTGPLTRKRMETCDDDFVAAAKDFIKRQHKDGKLFFCWFNSTHMHFRTHTKPKSRGQAGEHQTFYHDTMIDHDKNVGELLDLLDELGIADNTVVMYSTDNGPHMNTWPDGAMTPFRSEKNTNWEGAFRVPLMVRWPSKIPAGVVSNDIVQHHDWLPTFLAMAGEPEIVEKLKKGHKAGDKTFKVHIDGYNLLEFLTKKGVKSPRPRLHGAALPGNAAGLAGAVHSAEGPEALQPADRPVRAGRHHLQHVLGLVPVQGVPHPGGAGSCHKLPRDVQGVPAAPEGGELHHRPGDGEDGDGALRRRALTPAAAGLGRRTSFRRPLL
jgi:hypothetical protein